MSSETIKISAAAIVEIDAQIEELEAAKKRYKAKIAELTEQGETFIGDFKITNYINKRFDDSTAKAALTPEQYASILGKPKAESAKAKALLEPEDYARTQKTYDTVVKVEVRNDV